MATLTLTVGASADDAFINDTAYNDTNTQMSIGGVGTTPNVNFGYGWRFTNITLGATDTINSGIMKLMKLDAHWGVVTNRWTCVNEDNTATFSSGNPPGSRAIVATIVGESNNINHAAGTVYSYPVASGDQTSFGGVIDDVLARGGWASGNALAVIDNSDQDASAYQNFSREEYHTWDSSTASSEPQLVIDYTAGVSVRIKDMISEHGVMPKKR